MGQWVYVCVFLISSLSPCSYGRTGLCVSVCVIDCTAILCAFGGSGSELGRTPWSDGMFRVQQLAVSVQRAAKTTRLKPETQNTETVCCCDSVIVSSLFFCSSEVKLLT